VRFAFHVLWDRSLTSNTGLYTSPHLVAVRERIRINGEPLSEEDFTRYFFEVWDLLQTNTKVRVSFQP
jgi:folylpolyglutamate synthase